MKVIGIDPAPTKGLYTFDGTDGQASVHEAPAFMNRTRLQDDVLICWDAPLTGPRTSDGGDGTFGGFSQRPIESFFSTQSSGFKTPKGISVRPYSGCPHWAISRALVGLPVVGPYDAQHEQLPFRLVTVDVAPASGRHIVEVHPALALWLWCRNSRTLDAAWDYKHNAAVLAELWALLLDVTGIASMLPEAARSTPNSDDVLDARVSWLLGQLWLQKTGTAMLLGNADLGTFLLPLVPDIKARFDAFSRTAIRGGRRK